MKKIFLSLILIGFCAFPIIFPPTSALASLDPSLKECVQRGYNFAVRDNQTYCVFPDKSECLIDSFNHDTCGLDHKIKDYCIKQGGYVWDGQRCCGSLKYTENDHLAQATCEHDYSQELKTKIFLLVSQLLIGGFFFYKIQKKMFAS